MLGHGGTRVVQGRGRAVDYRSGGRGVEGGGGGRAMTLLCVGRREGGYGKEKKVRVCVRGREKEGCVFVRWAVRVFAVCLFGCERFRKCLFVFTPCLRRYLSTL